MHPLSILLLGMAMSTDAFAAAVGKGASMHHARIAQALRAGLIFGTIEGLTPLLGWVIGRAASNYVAAWDHWIAFLMLTLLGLHMIYVGCAADATKVEVPDRRDGFWGLAATGFATSIDALAVGASLAFIDVSILWVALTIGVCTFAMVTLGILLGRKLGALAGKRAEIIGGVVLIGVGGFILVEHLSRATG